MGFLPAIAIAACVLLAGCAFPLGEKPQISGSEGATPAAANSTGNVTAMQPGQGHGCSAEDGYEWCEARHICINPGIENCTEPAEPAGISGPEGYCGQEGTISAYACGNHVLVERQAQYGGAAIYGADGIEEERCLPGSQGGLCGRFYESKEGCMRIC